MARPPGDGGFERASPNSPAKAITRASGQAQRYARRKAAIETHLGEEGLPRQRLWPFAAAIDEGFLPN
jgi:hypothetical protein